MENEKTPHGSGASAARDDLTRRVDRTLAYVEELEHGPLAHETRVVLDAIRRSLTTPSRSGDSGATS